MVICIFFGIACVLVQLKFLNTDLKYYRQVEVMPIYMSSIILNSMAAGLFVLEESQFYTGWIIFLLAISSLITVAGVIVIMRKQETIPAEKS